MPSGYRFLFATGGLSRCRLSAIHCWRLKGLRISMVLCWVFGETFLIVDKAKVNDCEGKFHVEYHATNFLRVLLKVHRFETPNFATQLP